MPATTRNDVALRVTTPVLAHFQVDAHGPGDRHAHLDLHTENSARISRDLVRTSAPSLREPVPYVLREFKIASRIGVWHFLSTTSTTSTTSTASTVSTASTASTASTTSTASTASTPAR